MIRTSRRSLPCVALVLGALVLALPAQSTFTAKESAGTVTVKENGRPVLVYQRAPKSWQGRYERAHYVHPLFDLDGNVLTEDFPADHRHQRGLFWAWHQVWVGDLRLGDPWETRDFTWDVEEVSFRRDGVRGVLRAEVSWRSPLLRDGAGAARPVVSEVADIAIHPADGDRRNIDFTIALTPLLPGVRLGGSEDAKGYGGFSARLRLPDDVLFTGTKGVVEPKNLAIRAGAAIDLAGSFGKGGVRSGVAILQHPSLPGYPQPWILRRARSMQNPVHPGREPVPLSTEEPVVLRYRVVLHRGTVTAEELARWQREYAASTRKRDDGGWRRHVIDPATERRRGADGVRLGDVDGDGRLDVVTGWEEGGVVRVAFRPAAARVTAPWPTVTVGRVTGAEDAVPVDLDGDGRLDVVSCTEGKTRTVYFHWAPPEPRKGGGWVTEAVPATAGTRPWMYCLPMDVDGRWGVDLLVGAKGKDGEIGWLRAPASPRRVGDWTYHRIADAGWIMSLRAAGDGVLVSDRKGGDRGVWRLTPVRAGGRVTWRRERLGGREHEVMFLDPGPPVVTATRDGELLVLDGRGGEEAIPLPFGARWGKAVARGDIDLDGHADLVVTTNTAGDRARPGVSLLRRDGETWHASSISGPEGVKFDRIELVDLDGDGDLDVVTCEERDGLGVIWYENPTR